MLTQRYLITAEFDDDDFNLGWEYGRYWFRAGAVRDWEFLESMRTQLSKAVGWHWVIIDTKTNSVVRPLGETQETPRSP